MLCIMAVWARPAGAGQLFEYHYYKTPQTLDLDLTRIAIRSVGPELDVGAITPLIEAHEATVGGVSPLPIPRWHIIDLQFSNPQSAGDELVQLVLDLAGLEPVEFVSPLFEFSHGGWAIPVDEILIQTAAQTRPTALLRNGEGAIAGIRELAVENGLVLSSPQKDGFSILAEANALAVDPDIRFAEPQMIISGGAAWIPNDPGFGNCWGLHNTGQFGGLADFDLDGPEAWDLTSGDPGVIVTVIDCGIQQDHPDIHQIPGVDLTGEGGGGGPVNSFDRHGTAVAGTISGIINNAVGTVGIAAGCPVASARAFIAVDSAGKWVSMTEWTVEALDWAQSIGSRVTNNSNFYGFESSAIAQKYEETGNAGLVHFASAGNGSSAGLEYPARLPTVLGVGASQNTGTAAAFNSFGPDLNFLAPGVDVYTTDVTGPGGYIVGNYVYLDGTSFSSSYGAGVAALFLSARPESSPSTVTEALTLTATDMGPAGPDEVHGAGHLGALDALLWDPGCQTTPELLPEPQAVARSRYLSFQPGTSTRIRAISIVLAFPPPGFEALQGEPFWVGAPMDVQVGLDSSDVISVSELVCSPVFRDWSDIPTLHVTGEAVVPSGIYAIQSLYEACQSVSPAFSSPLFLNTSRWADLMAPFNPPDPTQQPDFADVAGVVDRFRGLPTAPELVRADLSPQIPDRNVDFSDVSSALDSFRGIPYPYAPPCPCGAPCP